MAIILRYFTEFGNIAVDEGRPIYCLQFEGAQKIYLSAMCDLQCHFRKLLRRSALKRGCTPCTRKRKVKLRIVQHYAAI